MGSIDLSVEGVMGAACMTVTLLVHNNVNTNDYGVLGIAVAIFVGSLIGLCNGLLNVYVRLPSLIATIGTWFAGLGYAYIIFPAHQPGLLYRPLTDLVVHKIFGLSVIVYISLAILAAAHLVFRYSVLGRAIYAIGGDEEIATLNAIPIGRVRIAAFTIAGTLFAVAGVLVAAQLENGYPNAGRDLLFPTIGAAVIGGTLLSGGRGGPLHSAVGVLTLGVLTNGMIQLGVGSYTRNIVIGAAIILAVAIGNWHLRHRLRVVK
jgi:ribose transport system permease protein